VARSLPELMAAALKSLGDGIPRSGAERRVPLMIYRTPSWSQWYSSLTASGNRLDGASVDWTFRVGPAKSFVLYWAIHADIHVTSEGRNKSNEVLAQPCHAERLRYPSLAVLLSHAAAPAPPLLQDDTTNETQRSV
jgi:hypothetical protein